MDCKKCLKTCGSIYNWQHDAHFCPRNDEWLETACSDPECQFCGDRPENPSTVARKFKYGDVTIWQDDMKRFWLPQFAKTEGAWSMRWLNFVMLKETD